MSKDIIKHKHGARDPMTLEEIAQTLGVTRERVRQIEAKALRKLRVKLRIRNISLQDFINAHIKD